MPAGPPCFGKVAEACAANPNRASQYKYIPAEARAEHDLPEGACVCKSKDCWRRFGMADEKRRPGRPSAAMKRARDDYSVVSATIVSTSTRSKPAIVTKIHSIKDAR